MPGGDVNGRTFRFRLNVHAIHFLTQLSEYRDQNNPEYNRQKQQKRQQRK